MMKLFCDLDGTLLDVAPRHYRVYSEVTQRWGGKQLAQPRYWELKRSKMPWAELLPLSGIDVSKEPHFMADFIAKIEDPAYLQRDVLLPGALATLATFEQFSADRYLVSLRRKAEGLREQLDWLGVSRFFTDIMSGHSESDGSDVKTALIADVLQQDQGVIIGDTEADIRTGRALGMTTIAVLSGLRNAACLRPLEPDYLVADIRQVPAILQSLER